MGLHSEGFRGEAERHGGLELVQRAHQAVEPAVRIGPQAVGPTEAGAQVAYAEFPQPVNRIVETRILEVKPLADAEAGRDLSEPGIRRLRCAVLTNEAHIEVAIVRRTFSFTMPRGRRPRARQIEEAVPVDARRESAQQAGRARQAELLHLVCAEARYADLRNPHGQCRTCA